MANELLADDLLYALDRLREAKVHAEGYRYEVPPHLCDDIRSARTDVCAAVRAIAQEVPDAHE